MRKPKADVIITTWNDRHRIKNCLDSVKKQKYGEFKVMIVDDGSTDGNVEFIRKMYPEFKVKVVGKGPAGNRNKAIRETNGDYIITMDSDAILIPKDWITKAIRFMEDNLSVGMCGGKLLLNDNIINSAGGAMTKRGNGFDIGHGDNSDKKEYNVQKDVVYVSTATSIIRRKMLNEIGLFDEDYGHGFEDADIGLRANICGWKVIYEPSLVSYHLADYKNSQKAKINAKTNYFLKKNKITTILKNYETSSLLIYAPLLILNFIFNLIFQKHRLSTLSAYLWNLKNIKRILIKRKALQEKRRIRDRQLFKNIRFSI